MGWKRIVIAGVFVAGCDLAPPQSQQPEPALEFTADEGCPDEAPALCTENSYAPGLCAPTADDCYVPCAPRYPYYCPPDSPHGGRCVQTKDAVILACYEPIVV